jgi:hypothetical protein
MGDYSNFSITVRGVDNPFAIKAIKAEVDGYTGGTYYERETTFHSLTLGANDVSLGTVGEIVDFLEVLIEKGVEDDDGEMQPVGDFSWWVNDEPAYEWMGTVAIHVPGVGDFGGSCDADGNPMVNSSDVADLVEAATDLATLKAEVEKLTGGKVLNAWHATTAALYAAKKEN